MADVDAFDLDDEANEYWEDLDYDATMTDALIRASAPTQAWSLVKERLRLWVADLCRGPDPRVRDKDK